VILERRFAGLAVSEWVAIAMVLGGIAMVWTIGCEEGLVRVVIERPTSQPYFAVQPPASQPYMHVGVTLPPIPRGLVENTNDFSHLFNGNTKYVLGGVIVLLLFTYPVHTWFRRKQT
jgi:hypothetical protein